MAILSGQICQGNCEVTDISNGTIYCRPIPDEECAKSGYIDVWHHLLAEVKGTIGEHIRLAVDWPTVADEKSAKDLLKTWNITEWFPKKMIQFPDWFFYLSTDLKEWKKIDGIKVRDGKIIVEFDMPQETAYVTSSLIYTDARYQALLNDVKTSEYVEVIDMCECSFGDTMRLFKVTDFSVSDDKKKHIYIQAALHCSETTGCYVSDYLIRYLISEAKGVSDLLKNYVFHIVPVVDVSGWRLALQNGTCKNELKNMNRDFGTFASNETRSVWEYVKNIYDQNPDVVAIDFHGGWPGERDDENKCVSWVGISDQYSEDKHRLLMNIGKMFISQECSFIAPPHCFSRSDDEEIAPCVSGPTTMVGYLGKNGIPAMLIELSYINAYDNEKDAVVQLSQPLLKRIAARMPHAIDKAFNM